MRYLNVTLVAAVALCGCSHGANPAEASAKASIIIPKDDPLLNLFDRQTTMLQVNGGISQAAIQASKLFNPYGSIHPESGVLMACGSATPWCGDARFQFPEVFHWAAAMANPGNPDDKALMKSWYDGAATQNYKLATVEPSIAPIADPRQAPFQLLAIANRLDQACANPVAPCPDTTGHWAGGEIHFVYGLAPQPHGVAQSLMVILEFTLPPFTSDLAVQWSNLNRQDPQYADQLWKTLVASGFSVNNQGVPLLQELRIRMNRSRSGPWFLSQLNLDRKSGSFQLAKLDNQMAAKPDPVANLGLWRTAQQQASAGMPLNYSIPPTLQSDPSGIQYNQRPGLGLDTPSGVCYSPPIPTYRNGMAMQQCTWCHTSETATNFAQILNHQATEKPKLSSFLAGPDPAGSHLHPDLVQLVHGDSAVVTKAPVQFATYTGLPDCTTTVQPSVTVPHYFHDVARRTLFLAGFLTPDRSGPFRTKEGTAVPLFFTTRFTH